jgi:hypothetical protein
VNIIGYAGGTPYKSVKNIPNLEPVVSVYFIYKRFFRERKKIEEWLILEKKEFVRSNK